ncbi:MAG: hypothetical protein A2X94_06610 [Bdellovibrionales bacterium GWB1_55_8]|nr:MAG: hypothetical protein A2X94_06610 [Bdellovibrionales bacterium GWB1_55_8]
MAHRTNVVSVKERVEASDSPREVTDPACGRKINPRDSKNMLFRGDDVIYFCSRECEMNFLNPPKKKAS